MKKVFIRIFGTCRAVGFGETDFPVRLNADDIRMAALNDDTSFVGAACKRCFRVKRQFRVGNGDGDALLDYEFFSAVDACGRERVKYVEAAFGVAAGHTYGNGNIHAGQPCPGDRDGHTVFH